MIHGLAAPDIELRSIHQFQWVARFASVLAAVGAVFATAALGAGTPWRSARVLAGAATALGGALLATWAQKLRQKLVFVDYVHADHH